MSHVIIRGENGRRHEVDFGETEITVSLHASPETVELGIEADDPDRASDKRRFALVNIHATFSAKPSRNSLGRTGKLEVR